MATTLVRNERRKLLATFLNTVGTGLVVVGAVAPLVTLWDSPAVAAALTTRTLAFVGAGFAFHLLGQFVLGGLRDDED